MFVESYGLGGREKMANPAGTIPLAEDITTTSLN